MSTLKGMTTMVLTAEDVDKAAEWYSDLLGIAPYFGSRRKDPLPMSSSGSGRTRTSWGS